MSASKIFVGVSAVVGLAFVGACTGSSSGGGSASQGTYKGLGSIWSLVHSGSTITLTHDADSNGTIDTSGGDMSVNADIAENTTTRFDKFTVTSAAGTNAPSPGDLAYGLEVPGFAYFIKPLDANSEPIVLLKSGSCPAGGNTLNWIIAKWDSNPNTNTDGFGTALLNTGASTLTVDPYKFSDGTALASTGAMTIGACTNSKYTFLDSGNATVNMFATSVGGMLVNPGSGLIFALPQLAADPVLSDLQGTYSGLIFTSNGSETGKVVLNSTGDGTGASINPETDATVGPAVTIDLTSVKAGFKGVVSGTITMADGPQPLNCVFSNVSGSKILACNGAEEETAGTYNVFFFLGALR